MSAVPARQVARRLIDRCSPIAERLGCLEELGYLEDIIENGTGAERQRRAYLDAGSDMDAVVRFLMNQSRVEHV